MALDVKHNSPAIRAVFKVNINDSRQKSKMALLMEESLRFSASILLAQNAIELIFNA